MKRWLWILLAGLSLLLPLGVHAEQVGVVTEVDGEVTVQRADQEFLLRPGVDIYPGDIIESFENSSAQLEMDDGSMISISSNASVSIDDYQLRQDKSVVRATINLLSGWLRFAVAKLRSDSSYQLSMPTAVLGVRGTEGVIEVSGSDESATTRIMLEEGEVEVAERVRGGRFLGQKVYLKPGQFAERRFGQLLLKRAKSPETFTGRLPPRVKVKLIQRGKLLKRRGIAPEKVKRAFREKVREKRLEEKLQKDADKHEAREKKLKQRDKSKEKRRDALRDKRDKRD